MLVQEYKKLRQNDVGPSGKTAYRITVRQLESMVRLSEAIARVYLENEVLPEYVLEASRLLRKSIIHVESEDVVLSERPERAQAKRIRDQQRLQEAEEEDGDEEEDGGKAKAARRAAATGGSKTLTFSEYKRITDMVVLYLRGCEDRGENGKTVDQLAQWYLEQCDSTSEEELSNHDSIIRLILKRLVKKDRILLESELEIDPEPVPQAEEGSVAEGEEGAVAEEVIPVEKEFVIILTVQKNYNIA